MSMTNYIMGYSAQWRSDHVQIPLWAGLYSQTTRTKFRTEIMEFIQTFHTGLFPRFL